MTGLLDTPPVYSGGDLSHLYKQVQCLPVWVAMRVGRRVWRWFGGRNSWYICTGGLRWDVPLWLGCQGRAVHKHHCLIHPTPEKAAAAAAVDGALAAPDVVDGADAAAGGGDGPRQP